MGKPRESTILSNIFSIFRWAKSAHFLSTKQRPYDECSLVPHDWVSVSATLFSSQQLIYGQGGGQIPSCSDPHTTLSGGGKQWQWEWWQPWCGLGLVWWRLMQGGCRNRNSSAPEQIAVLSFWAVCSAVVIGKSPEEFSEIKCINNVSGQVADT